MAKRTAKEVLDAIDAWEDEDAIDAEMERVLAMTPEERERELDAAGFDVQAEKAKARAWLEKARAGALPEAKVIPLEPRRRSTLRVLTAMAAAAACVLGLTVGATSLHDRLRPVTVGSSRTAAAQRLRETAFSECDAKHWEPCLRQLNEAREIDPDGESAAKVKEYRKKVEEKLR